MLTICNLIIGNTIWCNLNHKIFLLSKRARKFHLQNVVPFINAQLCTIRPGFVQIIFYRF